LENLEVLDFLRRHLSGSIPLGDAFFNDMLIVGSLVNIATSLCGFAMIAADLPVWLAIAAFLSPQPYNLVLLISVWRSATRAETKRAGLIRGSAIGWFALMVFV
jgi:ABC-type multidrug transport system permease subunit